MASFNIKSYDEETKTSVVSFNGSDEESEITFDDPESVDYTKMMAIIKASAGDGNVVPLVNPITELTLNEDIDCDTLI